MMIKNIKKESESKERVGLSEKMRVLKCKDPNKLKVRVNIRDLNLIKRELIRKALLFNENVGV